MNDLNWYISQADKVSRWMDYLMLNLKSPIISLTKILKTLDDDNSNVFMQTIWDYSLSMIKIRTRMGYALNISVSINNVPYTVFQYLETSEWTTNLMWSYWFLTYYSTYFRLIEIWLLDYSFEKALFGEEISTLLNSTISRVDYRIDFFHKNLSEIMKMEDVLDYRADNKSRLYALDKEQYEIHQNILFRRLMENKIIHYDIKRSYKDWDFQNWWEIWNRKNRSIIVRCYEKLIDCVEKGKVLLFDDYFNYKNVFRLECEFLSKFNKKFIKKINGKEFWEPFVYSELSELEVKILKFMWFEDKTENERFLYQYKWNKDIQFHQELRNQKDFGWRWFAIYQQWFNPFIVLYKVLKRKMMFKLKNTTPLTGLIIVFRKYIEKAESTVIKESEEKQK